MKKIARFILGIIPVAALGFTPGVQILSFDAGGNPSTVSAAALAAFETPMASSLMGTTLAANVVSSSLTSAAGGAFGSGAFAPVYSLPTASTSVLGGVKVDGSTITIANGVISSSAGSPSWGTITGTLSAQTDLQTALNAKLSANQTITLSGDATGSGATGITTTVGAINGVSMAGLGTGILKNTTGTGHPSIAVAGDFPTLNQSTTGNAATATALAASVNINGVAFNGGSNITVPAAAGTLTGNALAAGVTASSLTSAAGGSFGSNAYNSTAFLTGNQTVTLSGDLTGSGATAITTTLASVASAGTTGSSTAIPVVTIDAKGRTTGISTAAVVAPAGTLSGATLNATVTGSSLTGTGTLVSGATGSGFTLALGTSTVTGTLPFANGGEAGSAATSGTTGTMTVNMTTSIVTITPTGACTFNASGGTAGQLCTFLITTSGTSSFTLTWNTNYRSTGTLATGTTTAKQFAVTFRCISSSDWSEIARTAAM